MHPDGAVARHLGRRRGGGRREQAELVGIRTGPRGVRPVGEASLRGSFARLFASAVGLDDRRGRMRMSFESDFGGLKRLHSLDSL